MIDFTGSETLPSESELESHFDRLWPILRSITGNGVRKTHDILAEIVPLERMEVASGTKCFDWFVPDEWNVQEAYIETSDGERVVDVRDNNLHLVNYSIPFCGVLTRQELDKNLHSLPDLPNAIPYVTSYYERRWGFCLSDHQRRLLPDQKYKVVIKTTLQPGSMTLSEAVLPGTSRQEILISTYTCHPSMANNELSGPLSAMFLYRMLSALKCRRFTYRFAFLPETIGSIVYLSKLGDHFRDVMHAGFVLTCLGDPTGITYKRSRRGNSFADQAAQSVLANARDNESKILDFFPSGSDERQYCSPGFNLPVGVIARSWPAHYPEYHTSLDNKDCISFKTLQHSIQTIYQICLALELNQSYRNLAPFGEPNLGRRGLMSTLGATIQKDIDVIAIKWLLNFSDGDHDLFQISNQSGLSVESLAKAAHCLVENELLEVIE